MTALTKGEEVEPTNSSRRLQCLRRALVGPRLALVSAVMSDATITENQAKGRPDHRKMTVKRAANLRNDVRLGAPQSEGARLRGPSPVTFGLETADDRPLVGV